MNGADSPGRGRWAGIVAAVVALVAVLVVVLVILSGDEATPYRVRAVFDNAANVIPGEDVKIAGVKVGAVSSLHVVDNRYAAVVLQIDDPGFQDFRKDATCTIRMQSLIGEKFVACTPTQARAGGTPPPPLPVVPAGLPGAGEHPLSLSHTSSPVDPDLLNNIMRDPKADRFAVILNELGVGLAGRGNDVRQAVRRADPALAATDKVLGILADQNETLAKLATDSDAALAPIAREHKHVSGAIKSIGVAATATAERRQALALDFQKFPAFLTELTSTMNRLGDFADAGTPVAQNLEKAAPGLNQFSTGLAPLANALVPYFTSLGKTAEHGSTTVVEAKPAIEALTSLANDAGPALGQLASFLGNFQQMGGLEQFMQFVYNGSNSINGFDSVSHFSRGLIVAAVCASYAVTVTNQSCISNFIDTSSTSRASSARAPTAIDPSVPRDKELQRAAAVLGGKTPAQALTEFPDDGTTPVATSGAASSRSTSAGSSHSAATEHATATKTKDATTPLLNYLLSP